MVHRLEDGRLVSDLPDGRKAWLSLDPELQAHVERIFERYEVPFAALVAIEPATGRVLAYVSHSSANPDAGDLARDPTPPTASVFKVVTAAALLDAGVSSGTRVCYGGGLSRLRPADLQDDPARDTRCATFAEAIGRSINSVIAKLADRHLDAPTLERYAAAFGFGQRLPFDLPTRPSPAEVPAERLERARTAAGFWHMHMSPLHGALIAATVANGGQMPRASMVDRLEDRSGRVLLRHEPSSFRSVIPRSTARHLSEMMELTVSQGTARRSFFDAQGNAFLPGIRVAGKTGSLSAERPYRGYSWWVGHAPADHPQIALAALVVNSPEWRIKSSYAAREALREYLVERPRRQAREAAQTREAAAAAAPAP
ncbi:MAG: penicillin-binding transpeptidase domain-containing protein [Myxococcales bacterium]|nr:penicillin-binding transpeptidase domain-containing protein [Myxococcales bacterium]